MNYLWVLILFAHGPRTLPGEVFTEVFTTQDQCTALAYELGGPDYALCEQSFVNPPRVSK